MTDARFNNRDAAEYLSRTGRITVSPRTLDAWRAANRGPLSAKVQGRVFWLRSDLDQWLNAQLIETARGGVR
jgi:hypothetical protein